MYKIVDWFNQPMKGTFYQKELQKANIKRDDVQKIDKVIKYKGRDKNKHALVHWLNWPMKFNSWVPASEIKKLQFIMKVLYLSTNGDTTTVLPYPLELQGYGCSVIYMNGKITSPKSGSNGLYDNLYLCCNIVEESLVENVKMPTL